MKLLLITHAIVTFLGSALIGLNLDLTKALSFFAGATIMTIFFLLYAHVWRKAMTSLDVKKRFALPGSVIVLKYPLSFMVLSLLVGAGLNTSFLGYGIASAAISCLALATREVFNSESLDAEGA